jgi:hypothetical protein
MVSHRTDHDFPVTVIKSHLPVKTAVLGIWGGQVDIVNAFNPKQSVLGIDWVKEQYIPNVFKVNEP